MSKPGHANKVLMDLLEKFPTAATLTLAKKAYKSHPTLWPRLEACRLMVRYLRGSKGRELRRYAKKPRAPQQPGNPFGELPKGLRQIDGIVGLDIPGPAKALVLSDVHVPFHDEQSVQLALDEGSRQRCNLIFLAGDILDCHGLSRWETDPRERDFAGEMASMRRLLDVIGGMFAAARVVWKYGNHEERFSSYMQLKAPELLDIADFSLEKILECERRGIQTIAERQVVHLGKLSLIHGHEYRFAISNPVNPARGLFLRSRVNAICGHFHQPSHHSESDMDGKITSCWSLGCLSDLHPRYMPLNKWSHGFAIVDVGSAGEFSVANYRVIDGRVWT